MCALVPFEEDFVSSTDIAGKETRGFTVSCDCSTITFKLENNVFDGFLDVFWCISFIDVVDVISWYVYHLICLFFSNP